MAKKDSTYFIEQAFGMFLVTWPDDITPEELLCKMHRGIHDDLYVVGEAHESDVPEYIAKLIEETAGKLKKMYDLGHADAFEDKVNWSETHYEIVECMVFDLKEYHDAPTGSRPDSKIGKLYDSGGIGEMYDVARELTDKFQRLNEGRTWDGEFFDEVADFYETEMKDNTTYVPPSKRQFKVEIFPPNDDQQSETLTGEEIVKMANSHAAELGHDETFDPEFGVFLAGNYLEGEGFSIEIIDQFTK